jgi:hypothetical protein
MSAKGVNTVTSLVPDKPIALTDAESGETKHVTLESRIATKTFDAIHRCIVYKGTYEGREAVIKVWEVSSTPAGEEMQQMYVFSYNSSLSTWKTPSNQIKQSYLCTHTNRRYINEKDALLIMKDSSYIPAIFLDGSYSAHHINLEAKVLVMEWRSGKRLRTCWPTLSPEKKEDIRKALLDFFTTSLRRGIYHDDLRHLRNLLWDEASDVLTILDFELVGVQWKGDRESNKVNSLAEKETQIILEEAEQIKVEKK